MADRGGLFKHTIKFQGCESVGMQLKFWILIDLGL